MGITPAEQRVGNFINFFFSFYSMWPLPTSEQIFYLLYQGWEVYSTTFSEALDWRILQSSLLRPWTDSHSPPSFSTLPNKIG